MDHPIGVGLKEVDLSMLKLFYLDFGLDPSWSFIIATLFNKEFIYFVFP